MREAHLPTQQPEAQEEARLSRPDADSGRPRGAEVAAATGPQASRRLIWRVRDRGTFEALERSRPHVVGPIALRRAAAGPGPPRVAYAVGRRVGGAVARNRLRRRLRAAVRASADRLEPGTAYLFSAGPKAMTTTFQALERAVRELLGSEEAR
jgi:ribonuclease P protein component